jgi:hypothetical protein
MYNAVSFFVNQPVIAFKYSIDYLLKTEIFLIELQ